MEKKIINARDYMNTRRIELVEHIAKQPYKTRVHAVMEEFILASNDQILNDEVTSCYEPRCYDCGKTKELLIDLLGRGNYEGVTLCEECIKGLLELFKDDSTSQEVKI